MEKPLPQCLTKLVANLTPIPRTSFLKLASGSFTQSTVRESLSRRVGPGHSGRAVLERLPQPPAPDASAAPAHEASRWIPIARSGCGPLDSWQILPFRPQNRTRNPIPDCFALWVPIDEPTLNPLTAARNVDLVARGNRHKCRIASTLLPWLQESRSFTSACYGNPLALGLCFKVTLLHALLLPTPSPSALQHSLILRHHTTNGGETGP